MGLRPSRPSSRFTGGDKGTQEGALSWVRPCSAAPHCFSFGCSLHSNGAGLTRHQQHLDSLLNYTACWVPPQSPVQFQRSGAEAIRGNQVWASGLHREQHRVRGHSLARLRQAVQTWPRAMLRGVSSLRTKWAKPGLRRVFVWPRGRKQVWRGVGTGMAQQLLSADMREEDREPACRQAEAGRTQAHEGQFSLKGTLSTCVATGVAGGVHGGCWQVLWAVAGSQGGATGTESGKAMFLHPGPSWFWLLQGRGQRPGELTHWCIRDLVAPGGGCLALKPSLWDF